MAISCPGQKTNYSILRNKERPKKVIDPSLVVKAKETLLSILKKDYEEWQERGHPQPGVERNNLSMKLGAIVQVTPDILDYVLEDLEAEQKVIPMKDGNLTRYIYLNLKTKS